MQQPANGCFQHNGASDDHLPSSSNQQNGTDIATDINNAVNGELSPKRLDKTDYEIVRLIGQHLKTIGLKWVGLIWVTFVLWFRPKFSKISFYGIFCITFLISVSSRGKNWENILYFYSRLCFKIYSLRPKKYLF